MAKLLLLVTLVTTALTVQGEKFNFTKFMNRRDPFPEPKNPPEPTSVVTNWVTQRVDNFDPANDATWEQRYMMNGEYFQSGGCIFVFIGGEWAITPYRLEFSLMVDMSQEFFCYIFYLEHHYYGESRPTDDISNENLRFLNVDQALADTAHFIEHIKLRTVTPGAQDSPVIVLGGQYSASLAVWFRQSYPHLAIGAWAFSAPTVSVVDHFSYKELAGAVYRHIGGDECYERIERGFAEMEQMVENGQNDQLAEMFLLCNELEHELDIQMFFSIISEFYSLMAQFDQIVNIAGACNIILNDTITSDAEGVASILHELLDGECVVIREFNILTREVQNSLTITLVSILNSLVVIDYEAIIEYDRQTNWDDPAVIIGLRQWSYQSCTQLGWYHSSSSRFQPFGSSFPVEFIFQACEDVFEELFSPELMLAISARLNTAYGGLEPEATNVLYVHGQLDPWRSVGVQTDQGNSTTVIVIEGASQGNDLGPITSADSPQLIEAKQEIKQTIYRWIRESQGIEIIPFQSTP